MSYVRRRRMNYGKLARFLLILIFIVALIVTAISSCRMLTERTLKVGICESSRPLAYLDDRRNPAGFEVEYARLLAGKLEKKSSIKFMEPEDMAAALEDGTLDCVVSTRRSVHDYIAEFGETQPFIEYGTVLTRAPDDGEFSGEADLDGRRVGVIINSEAELLCDELLTVASFDVRKYDYEAQPFQDLKLKKNDVVIADELYALYMQKEDPESYFVLETIYNKTGYGVRLPDRLAGQDARDIEDAVEALRTDAALVDAFVDWFGADLS